MKKRCTAHLECGRDGFYSVYSEEDFPFGFFGEGNTAEEAKADFFNLFEAMSKDHFQRIGEMVEADFSFVFDASAFLQHYKGILTLSGLSSITGINKVQLSQYVCEQRHPSQKTHQKIKASVIAFAEELSHALA